MEISKKPAIIPPKVGIRKPAVGNCISVGVGTTGVAVGFGAGVLVGPGVLVGLGVGVVVGAGVPVTVGSGVGVLVGVGVRVGVGLGPGVLVGVGVGLGPGVLVGAKATRKVCRQAEVEGGISGISGPVAFGLACGTDGATG
jgi:hypothetical protein